MLWLELFKDKSVILFSSIVTVVSLVCFFFSSFFIGALFITSLLSGLLLPFVFFNDGRHVPNLLGLFTSSVYAEPPREKKPVCSVCTGECVKMLNSKELKKLHVQNHFTVPQSVDEALEELLNLVLDNHIYSWYKEITIHDQLADEVRFLIRYAASNIACRLSKVDLTTVILDRLIPAAIHHLDAYVEGSRGARGGVCVEAAVVRHLQANGALHRALRSRDDEAAYLRAVVGALFPIVIPVKYQDSLLAKVFLEELLGRLLILQGLDLLADPDTVNLLFLLLLTSKDSAPWAPAEQENQVLFLKAFSSVNTHPRNSVLRSNLSSVLKDQPLLNLFHCFLKEERSINILSFCLSVEDFNRHILDPDLTPEQMENLHMEAMELYHTFMAASSPDRLDFQPDIVQQIEQIVKSEVGDIVKLRTTRPLFQAYEYAYNVLEREFLPLFMNSNAYFSYLCGSKSPNVHQRSSSRDLPSVGKAVVQRVGIGLAHLGRMTLRPSVITGNEDFNSHLQVETADDVSSRMTADESVGARGPRVEPWTPAFRDLTAWRVSIPRIEQRHDDSGKLNFVFIVDVTRIDVPGDNPEELHWEVERRFHEFYILESKLTEFHGEFPDNVLPPRRSLFTSKGINFMQAKKQVFEEFLQKLLQKPSLKGSQLLFLFLKMKDEFTSSFLPDVSLGRLLKEVPRKLMKERGQKLDSFVTSFISGTSFKSSDRLKSEDQFEEPPPSWLPFEDPQLTATIFVDNAHSLQVPPTTLPTPTPLPPVNISGVYETVLYVAVRVYGVSLQCVRWAICLKALVGNTLDAAIAFFLRSKLSEALAAPRIVKLIHLTRDALFVDPPPHRSQLERMIREKEIRSRVFALVPSLLQKTVFAPELYAEGANTLVNLFQHPVLNKQLSYVLLDLVLQELYPELKSEVEGKLQNAKS